MRILIIDINCDYRNPIYRQFYTSLSYCMDVDYFGPGYVKRECLEEGLKNYISMNGSYDAVIMTTGFLSSIGDNRMRNTTYSWHRECIPYYKVNDALQCCRKIYMELLRLTGVIKIYDQQDDYCSIKKRYYQVCCEIIESGFYILSWPKEYMSIYSKHNLSKEMRNYGVTNYAYWLCEKYETKYIPIPLHGIGFHEIFVRNFADRDFEWCVPGNRQWKFYSERSAAYDFIGKDTKMWRDDPYQKMTGGTINKAHMDWYRFRNRFEKCLALLWGKNLAISAPVKMKHIAACRELYLESMRSSKYVYCDGGFCGLVRKYFETCASGAVLVAKKVPGLEQMGFVHEKNCIVIDRYEDIKSVPRKYSEEQLAGIARAGQQFILEKHMFHHRAKALEETIDAIKQGKYKGAYWDKGDYVLRT